MKIVLALAILSLAGNTEQCEDRGGPDFCRFILRSKNNMCDRLSTAEVAECMKTCGACQESSAPQPKGPPVWAVAPPTQRPPGPGPNRRNPNRSEDDPLALPLYAVIIIVVAVLVIFIGITICVFKLKHKWKKRKQHKLDKNRRLLQNAPAPNGTMHPSYVWTTGSYNSAYQPEMGGWVGSPYPQTESDRNQSQNRTLNNTTDRPGIRAEKKNINILQNGTKDKRKAPEPPKDNEDSTYQNLQDTNKNKPDVLAKSRAPAPPPQVTPSTEVFTEIPVQYSDSVFSVELPGEETHQKNNWSHEPPMLPPREVDGNDDASAKKNQNVANVFDEEKINVEDDESDTMTVQSDSSFDAATENTDQTVPVLADILNEWKEHLQEQKRELEDYYKNLHNYVKTLGLKRAGEEANELPENLRRHSENIQRKRNRSEPPIYSDRPYASIHENYSGVLKFPEPPESVRGDFTWEPNDESSQRQVIVDLKKKLARLQNLLESTQDAVDSEKKSSAFYMPSQNKYQDRRTSIGDRVTIKSLLQSLEERDRLKVQVRIAKALDTSRRRGGMNIGAKDGPITCLSKQVHHVMNDILDPRTSTKVELGAQAARTLANKLLTNVYSNLLPVLRNQSAKQTVEKTSDRISILSKQLLDMTKQLMARQMSFHSKDYCVFVNAFVDTTEKIMDTTFHLVCVIVDLQREERRGLIKNLSQTMPSPARDIQRHSHQSLPHHSIQEKDQILMRLHSESNSTSLSAVDVRQLNQDLVRLRQLLQTETQIPSFSGITTPRNLSNQKEFPITTNSELQYGDHDTECDTMSTLSCSTCMGPQGEDQYYYEEDLSHAQLYPELEKLSPPTQRVKPKPDGKVQYTEIVFDQENYRPSTRPKKIQEEIMPQEVQELVKPLAITSDQTSQPESAKDSQRKPSSLEPSSFASFHTDNELKNALQPRHQAMLARYFGGEVLEPKPESEKPVDNLKEAFQNENAQLFNIAAATPLGVDEADGFPRITMLPCGLVANDTPPIANPPKEKRRMPKIPEITVYRNGEEASGSFEEKKNETNEIEEHQPKNELADDNLLNPAVRHNELQEGADDYTLEYPKENSEKEQVNQAHNANDEGLYPETPSEFRHDSEADVNEQVPIENTVIDDNSDVEDIHDIEAASSFSSSSNSSESECDDSTETTKINPPSDEEINEPDNRKNAVYGGLISEFEFPRVDSPAENMNEDTHQRDELEDMEKLNNGKNNIPVVEE